MAKDSRLGGRVRTRINAEVRALTDRPVCPMCGYGIDRNLRRTGQPHPLSSVIDEWQPRNVGGQVDVLNCVEMHRTCNGTKHDHWPVTAALRTRCRTKVEELLGRDEGAILERSW